MNNTPTLKPMYCYQCRAEEVPLTEPIKKRLVRLICARCGNSIGVRYVPKKRSGGNGNTREN